MILDEVAPQFVPGRRPRVSSPPIEVSELSVNVFEPAITMAKLHEDLQEAAMLLSEVNEHSLIVVRRCNTSTTSAASTVGASKSMEPNVYVTETMTTEFGTHVYEMSTAT